MIERWINALENEPIFCLSLLIIWIFMLVMIYKDAKGLNVDERIVIGLVFFAPFLMSLLFGWWSIYIIIGIPIFIWLLYRNLLVSGKGLISSTSSSPTPQRQGYMERTTESTYEASSEVGNRETRYETQESSPNMSENRNTDPRFEGVTSPPSTETGYETPGVPDSSPSNRCPECGREVEDEWNVCIDCGNKL